MIGSRYGSGVAGENRVEGLIEDSSFTKVG